MASIVLSTLNARFIHASVGLRYLYANLGELQSCASIREFEVSQPAREIVEAILQEDPILVGFGVYIWNVTRTHEVVRMLKKVRPNVTVVIGGPEVSFDYERQPIFETADYLITGEADLEFARFCQQILSKNPPPEKVIRAKLPELSSVQLPYAYYSDCDLAHRVVYVEASRGCPFTCEFCLSSIDIPVRQFETESVLKEIDLLFQRGARTFKFIDRTFNLKVATSLRILQFFLDRMVPGLFVHFEMVPDRFPTQLREVVARFPAGSLQLEIGVQTLNSEVSSLISRRQNIPKLLDNLSFLRRETGAYLHVDLIAGLPSEGLESFARGFDTLVALEPHEIQVGILKKLKGTPIARHDTNYEMTFSEDPPFEVLQTRDISFLDLQRISRFARYWDLVANSGNFISSKHLLWKRVSSPFAGFMEFSDWLFKRVGRRAAINLKSLTECVAEFLQKERGLPLSEFGPVLVEDYERGRRADVPIMLRGFVSERSGSLRSGNDSQRLPLKRQNRAANIDERVKTMGKTAAS